MQKEMNKTPNPKTIESDNNDFPGYPGYPPSEDIYNHDKEIKNGPHGSIMENDEPNVIAENLNEKSFMDDVSGDDLDVPGSELDNVQEEIGSEDEENNYYSIGGDNHDDLEEDKGD